MALARADVTVDQENESDCYLSLELLFKKWGVPDELRTDNSKDQGSRKTDFQRILRQYQQEKESEQTSVVFSGTEATDTMVKLDSILEWKGLNANDTNGRTPHKKICGETPDIPNLLDLSYYDWCWYRPDGGSRVPEIGRWLGPSDNVGDVLSYWILPATGIPTACSTVQWITNLEMQEDSVKEKKEKYTAAIEREMRRP